jgi:hypothetical protein
MGDFSNQVRRNKISGPNQRNYDRALWKTALESAFDEEDQRIISAGLFFDRLLSFIRSEKNFSAIKLNSASIIRVIVAISSINFKAVMDSCEIKKKKEKGGLAELQISSLLERKLTIRSGQDFHPDELLSGLGDGMKHILRELLNRADDPSMHDEHEIEIEEIDVISKEFNTAIIYQCAVEYWHDCLSNSFGVEAVEGGVAVTPKNIEMEKARSISIYRRNKISMIDGMLFWSYWKRLPLKERKNLCRIPLVDKIYGDQRISKIDIGFKSSVIESGKISIGTVGMIKTGPYAKLLDEALPDFSGLTLNEVIDGWRLLQSLSLVMFDNLKSIRVNNVKDFLRYAPTISRDVLVATFSRAFQIDREKSARLLEVFVFGNGKNYDTWSQPLIPIGSDFCLALPCIHSINLLRVVEGWMRRGGLDLDRRGKEFEIFCIDEIDKCIKKSSIKTDTQLIRKSIKFHFSNNRSEEIDVIIIIADTILLIEAKCVLWPDDSLQFANYRDTVEKATAQITRKYLAVRDNFREFSERLQSLGYKAPVNPKIVPCVLTNSAVYSGFKFNDVAVVDLPILTAFFSNRHSKFEKRFGDKIVEKHEISFFMDGKNAGQVVESYLGDPPQLSDLKIDTKSRQIEFPIKNEVFGAIFHDIFSVEVNIDRMEKLYGKTLA